MRNIRVYDKILKKYIPFNGCYSFEDPTLVFEEGIGLKDNTGKEIFIGDLIQDIPTTDIYRVIFHLGQFQGQSIFNSIIRPFYTYKVYSANDGGGIVSVDEVLNPLILGNVNENPELLKI